MTTVANRPILILRNHYFLHFSVMGIFLPYFNLYCYHLDYSEFQIGLLSALRILSMVFFSVIWGIITDNTVKRKTSFICCTIIGTLIWSLLMVTENYHYVLIIIFLYSIFYGPLIAFLETYSLEVLNIAGENKTGYGTIRVWGSFSFILMSICIGPAIQHYSLKIIVLLILITSTFQAVYSFWLPNTSLSTYNVNFSTFKYFFSFRTCLFLLSSFFMLLSHGTYYGFFSIHLERIGFNPIFIGIAWGLASLSEIVVMLKSERLFKHFSINTILIFSFLIACIRWLLLFYTKNIYIILLSQLLHAITYGAFHIACILYMDRITSKETKTFGQIVNNSTSYGLGMMCGFIINGMFFQKYGEGLFIFSCLCSLTGCLILFFSFQLKAKQ